MLRYRDRGNVCEDVGLSSTWWRALAVSWSLCSLTGGKDFASDGTQLYGGGGKGELSAVSVCLSPGLRSLPQ